MRKSILIIVIFVLYIGQTVAQSNKRHLTDTEKIMGLSNLWAGAKQYFVYYDKLPFSWDSLYQASIPKVLAMKTTDEYLDHLLRMGAMLNDGHTRVIVWSSDDPEEKMKSLPFLTKLYDKRIFVDKVFSSALEKEGVVSGVEIVKMNGENPYEYGQRNIVPYTGSSTPQWTDYRVYETETLTKAPVRQTTTLEIKDKKGKIKEVVVSRKLDWDKQENKPLFNYKELPNKIGYLQISNFWENSFRKDFDEIYEKLKPTEGLIIDVRNNTGGNSGNGDYIIAHLTDTAFIDSEWRSPMYVPAFASWNRPLKWYIEKGRKIQPVKKEKYLKPIVVLTNRGTFSAAEDFSVKFKGMKRGKLIGSATGGSTGNPIGIVLIDGVASAMFCTKQDIAPDGTIFVGVGVLPDIELYDTLQDYLNGKDIVLDRAVKELSPVKNK